VRFEQAFNAKFLCAYGMTECLPGFAHHRSDIETGTAPLGSCGKLLFEEVKLVDQNGETGNYGELLLRNPTVTRCYLDDGLNDSKIQSDGWLKTGDLFFRNDDGYFFHRGRVDEMFSVNGRNIYPAEIESALVKHPSIEKAFAAPVTDNEGSSLPAVIVQTQSNMTDAEIVAFFIQKGASHALPKVILTVKRLPELSVGKTDRRACKAMLQAKFDSANAECQN
jgi:acyl-CoA synthetase (AMP-forming)/AMP-acid ligase II